MNAPRAANTTRMNKAAIAAKDSVKFAATYKTMLESCYSCHKSVGRPYLKPMIPKRAMKNSKMITKKKLGTRSESSS